MARAVSSGVPIPKALLDATVSLSSVVLADATPRDHEPEVDERSLRERGEELLQRSRDVWSEQAETHGFRDGVDVARSQLVDGLSRSATRNAVRHMPSVFAARWSHGTRGRVDR